MPPLTPKQITLLKATPLAKLLPDGALPDGLIATADGGSALDALYYTDYHVRYGDNAAIMSVSLAIAEGVEFALPGLNYIALGIGEGGFVPFTVRVLWTSDILQIGLEDIALALWFSPELLKSVKLDAATGLPVDSTGAIITIDSGGVHGDFVPVADTGDDTPRVSLSTRGSIYVNKDFDISLVGFDSVDLSPCKIPGLDMYVVLRGIQPSLSATPIPEIQALGFQTGFQGVYIAWALFHFQGDLKFLPDITAENFAIGTGGISGKITATFDLAYDAAQQTFTGDAAGDLFGAAIGLGKFELELRANEVVASEITGQMVLPFFDKPVEIELSFDLKGNISVGLKGTDGAVLAELTKDDILSMKINSFNFAKTQDEVAFTLGGSIKPLFGENTDWPEFGVNALKVSRELPAGEWDVNVEGGWIEFPDTLSFSISSFRGWISKVGFGTIEAANGDKERFIGFSGGIAFVSGFALAAEFDDLQLFYPTTTPIDFSEIRLELKRARIGLQIPNAISLIGEVSKKANGFGGMIDITIIPTELRIMGGAEFGRTNDFSYMQIMMALELPPPGIQLGSTPLAIRGFEGKYAQNMTSSMDPGWEWAIAPPRGIMPLSKMIPYKGGTMLGAGLKITSTDGTLVTINALFALMLPGPVVLIEGRGAILKKEGDQSSLDAGFYALVVINGREKYISVNLAVNADLAKGIISVTAMLEMFFDMARPSNWHIYMGQKEPKSKRVQAVAFKVLRAQAYFELSSGPHLVTGAYIGIEARKDFKVGYAVIKAYIDGGVDLSWKPEHASGFLTFVAEIAIKVCGFGAGLGAYGQVDANSPYPRYLHLAAGYEYFFNLPWPLPDAKGEGEVERTWQGGQKYPCAFEPLVSEVLVDSEIPGIEAKALQRFGPSAPPPILANVPLVNLDARPTLRFAYPMNDDSPPALALAGNASNGLILHRIGADEHRFSLVDVTLERLALPDDPVEFEAALTERIDPTNPDWQSVDDLFGVWVLDSSMTGHSGATTLRLLSATSFGHYGNSMFAGGLVSTFGTQLESSSAAWLTSISGDGALFGADSFLAQIESGAAASAAYLSDAVQDQSPEYPLGQPEAEWRYLGFADVPVTYGAMHVDVTNGVGVHAAHDAEGEVAPFDVIDLYMLPPSETTPEVHNVPTLVRGVYFEGTIQVRFSVPVSKCELYLYPVKRRSASWDLYPGDWPDEGRPEVDHPTLGQWCERTRAILNELVGAGWTEHARAKLKELTAVIEECCKEKPKEEPHSGKTAFPDELCEKFYVLLPELADVIEGEVAQALFEELVALIEECCAQEYEDPRQRETFREYCCDSIYQLLPELAREVQGERAQVLLEELTAVIEACCVRDQDEPHPPEITPEYCCEKIYKLLAQLDRETDRQRAQPLLTELTAVIEECCELIEEFCEQERDKGMFLAYDFAPTPEVLASHPPQLSTSRRSGGQSTIVPHTAAEQLAGNLYRVHLTAKEKAFNEIGVGNRLEGQGLFLVAIGYLPDVAEGYEKEKEKIEQVVRLAWLDGDAPVVLSPRHCYRLTVETAADCDDSAPQTHTYYFRTDGPPAKDIRHYVAWTVPGVQGYPFFRDYDVSIRFRTSYVDQFFDSVPLELHLNSGSGLVKSSSLDDGLAWQDEDKHLLRPEEQAYIEVLNASGAITPIDPNEIPGDKSLVLAGGGANSANTLEPDQAYTAVLKLAPRSNYHVASVQVAGSAYRFTQYLPAMVTAASRLDAPKVGKPKAIGSSEDFQEVEVTIDEQSSLFEFSFRTSRFTNFAEMFSHFADGQAEIPSIAAADVNDLRTALADLAKCCEQVWRPAQLQLWEKQLLVRQRLAKEDGLLELMDNRAHAGAELDQAFGNALTHLPELAGVLLQPRPRATQIFFSPSCILVQLPEPVEFARVGVSYEGFDVLVACSSDETRWLIFPVVGTDKFARSGLLTLTYQLDIGADYPRLRYGSLTSEQVEISLGAV